MADTPTLKFYNTLAREKQVFEPIDAENVLSRAGSASGIRARYFFTSSPTTE